LTTERRRLLIVHDDGAIRLSLMRTFESAGWGTQGVRTHAGAETWLNEGNPVNAILLSWDLPDQGAPMLLLSLNSRALEERPAILAYAAKWALDDLQRAVQLGADGILRTPLTLESVAADLDALQKSGETRSRRALLDQAAEALLRPVDFIVDEDAERAEQNRQWVDDMRSMAGNLRDFLRRLRGLDSEEEPVDVAWLRTLVDSMRQAESNVDMGRLRALIQSDAWNDQIDEVTRRRLMQMFNRRTESELRLDLERLRKLFGPELMQGGGLDVERLRVLLERPEAEQAFDAATRDRLRGLRGRDWRTVVDYVQLEDLKARFGRKASDTNVDKDRMRGLIRAEDEEEAGLSPEEQMRLQLTMAMMFRVRNDEDRGKLVDRLRGAHGNDGRTALRLKGMLSEMSEERTIQMLRSKMGVSPGGATPTDVMKLLSKNDLDSSIFGVAEVPDEHPDSVPLLNEIGMRLKRAQRWDEAAEHYERALEIMPKEPGLLFNFARLKFDLGEAESALTLVNRMDAESQGQTPVRTLRGAIERQLSAQRATPDDSTGG
jgi:DNA-binding response OmpR family regulator